MADRSRLHISKLEDFKEWLIKGSSQGASNYCPNCGTKMDNSDIEERIQKAIREAI